MGLAKIDFQYNYRRDAALPKQEFTRNDPKKMIIFVRNMALVEERGFRVKP